MELKKLIMVIVVLVGVWIVGTMMLAPAEGGEKQNIDSIIAPEAITANHIFADGTHTLSGSINLPSPCHGLTHEITIAESYPEQVMIAFNVENGSDYCAQVITENPFVITVRASREARFRATINDAPVELRMRDAGITEEDESANADAGNASEDTLPSGTTTPRQ